MTAHRTQHMQAHAHMACIEQHAASLNSLVYGSCVCAALCCVALCCVVAVRTRAVVDRSAAVWNELEGDALTRLFAD